MTERKIKRVVALECGCKTIDYEDGDSAYDPCLVCAVNNAANMMLAVGRRLQEGKAQGQRSEPLGGGSSEVDGGNGESPPSTDDTSDGEEWMG